MKLLDALEINNTITNTKGGEYYKSSYDANLDLFCAVSRFQEDNEIEDVFYRAYKEDKNLAVAVCPNCSTVYSVSKNYMNEKANGTFVTITRDDLKVITKVK